MWSKKRRKKESGKDNQSIQSKPDHGRQRSQPVSPSHGQLSDKVDRPSSTHSSHAHSSEKSHQLPREDSATFIHQSSFEDSVREVKPRSHQGKPHNSSAPLNASLNSNTSLPPTKPALAVHARKSSIPAPVNPGKPYIPLPLNPGKNAITVPLPSAPLNAESILESLNSTLSESTGMANSTNAKGMVNNGGGGRPVSTQPNTISTSLGAGVAGEELQKVIERQRTQIELLSQITQLVSGHSASLQQQPSGRQVPSSQSLDMSQDSSLLPSRLASRTHTFDYANQSNKKLEEKAFQELDRGYQRGERGGWDS